MPTPRLARSAVVACVAVPLFAICLMAASTTPASAQLTGGLEGRFTHHVFEYVPAGSPSKVVVEAWSARKTGVIWVRGTLAPEVLEMNLTLHSRATDVGPPRDAEPLFPKTWIIDAPTWLEQGHVWSRPRDGIADTGLRLVLEPNCRSRCAVVSVERYHLPGAGGMVGERHKLSGVDRYPLEPGDTITVFAPR